ncbi:DUF3099 domain-containing protein [Nocardioides jishulii]|uniref:DUF3099 domain-containing protein n=1 Tax=Nocardioides jishulii TaxID=2575440 RepID=A0A4U2YM48_9ACTN|nr:DUF3099 domain-containing protein [Nocardioides jishulii]QCX27509.1 DUF3099 domain-containing protein [Nocardioides jishulii]TKI62316.1 DUF3099 domain-containing protein [Nocardioides jishulii]
MPRRRARDGEAIRITSAGANRSEEIDGRVRGYLISMSIRVACFAAAVLVGPGILRWVLIAGAVLLPYVAVVMANATDFRNDAHEMRPLITDPQLEGPSTAPGLGEKPAERHEDLE